MSVTYKRGTLLVSDLERSLQVYRDILGFTVNYVNLSAPDSYSYPVFNLPEETKITFCALDSPTQQRTFALTEVKGYDLPKENGPRMAVSVIQVTDLKTAISKIEALGLKTLKMRVDSTDGQSYMEQAFIDFDGHLILLYEIIEN